ncbi:MAG: cytochrome c [Thermotogae bacterium]|nr:cytochrome c [Thermotogota bacterium]
MAVFWFLFVSNDDLSIGRNLYRRYCLSCHVPGNRFVPPAPPLEKYRATEDFVLRVMEEGVPGANMPRFSYLSDDTKRRIAEYIASFNRDVKVDTPPDLLRRGEKIYYDVCAPCHGDDGSGSTFGDDVPPPPDLRYFNPLPERTVEVLDEGIPGTAMYSFKDILSPEDKRAVALYILTLFKGR